MIELYPGVQVASARTWSAGNVQDPASVMADAPTMSIRVVP